MKVFAPLMKSGDKPDKGRIVIGTIFGDTHDIGKNIVSLLLSGAGYDVLDLGRDVSAENFVDGAIEYNADIIAISTLMTTTMNNMKDVVDLLIERGVRDRFRVIIGGKPCSLSFAKKIGADGYSSNAPGALRLVKKIMLEKKSV
ncbi:MAG: B12-binding domain-containing protein [Eubacteriales bacterium]